MRKKQRSKIVRNQPVEHHICMVYITWRLHKSENWTGKHAEGTNSNQRVILKFTNGTQSRVCSLTSGSAPLQLHGIHGSHATHKPTMTMANCSRVSVWLVWSSTKVVFSIGIPHSTIIIFIVERILQLDHRLRGEIFQTVFRFPWKMRFFLIEPKSRTCSVRHECLYCRMREMDLLIEPRKPCQSHDLLPSRKWRAKERTRV